MATIVLHDYHEKTSIKNTPKTRNLRHKKAPNKLIGHLHDVW